MSDLISRAEVIEIIDKLGYVNCHDGRDYEANNRVDKVRQSVTELLTAYDVDKVVEQICGCEGCRGCFEENKMMECKKYARIYEIVKAGGVNETN